MTFESDKSEWYTGHRAPTDIKLEALNLRVVAIDSRVANLEASAVANNQLLQEIRDVLVVGKLGTAAIKWLGMAAAAVLGLCGVIYLALHGTLK